MSEFKNQAIVITGGSGGMGLCIAESFLKEGAEVYLADINKERLEKAVADLGQFGKVDYIVTDVTSVASIENMISEVASRAGKIDVVVNTAGVWVEGDSDKMTEDEWDRTVNVNLKGTFFVCSRAIPELEKTGGCIVNISSIWGTHGASCETAYSATKHAIIGLTRSLAAELAPSNIRVNCITPGVIDTDMVQVLGQETLDSLARDVIPMGRLGRPEEIARAVLYLARDASYTTGQILSCDGGFFI